LAGDGVVDPRQPAPYSELQVFPKLLAFNIGLHEAPKRTIYSFIPPRGFLTKPGFPNHNGEHSHLEDCRAWFVRTAEANYD